MNLVDRAHGRTENDVATFVPSISTILALYFGRT